MILQAEASTSTVKNVYFIWRTPWGVWCLHRIPKMHLCNEWQHVQAAVDAADSGMDSGMASFIGLYSDKAK